jgi:hypothetical protein
MHSCHMLREGTWPDHVRVNLGHTNIGHANIDVTQIVYGKSRWKQPPKELTDTYHGSCSPLR